jgi:hypothetical protein
MMANAASLDKRAATAGIGPLLVLDEVPPRGRSKRFEQYSDPHKSALQAMAEYILDFVAVPNINAGRSGPVCRYAPAAIENRTVHLAVAQKVTEVNDVRTIAVTMLELLPMLDPVETAATANAPHMLKCLFVLLPELGSNAASVITEVQITSKANYTERGYMVGELFPKCPARGLRNPDFHPFDTPVPAIGIRRMTEYDYPFLLSDDRYLASYISRFGAIGCSRISAHLPRIESEDDRTRIFNVIEDYYGQMRTRNIAVRPRSSSTKCSKQNE